jgi:hypothetical protein
MARRGISKPTRINTSRKRRPKPSTEHRESRGLARDPRAFIIVLACLTQQILEYADCEGIDVSNDTWKGIAKMWKLGDTASRAYNEDPDAYVEKAVQNDWDHIFERSIVRAALLCARQRSEHEEYLQEEDDPPTRRHGPSQGTSDSS